MISPENFCRFNKAAESKLTHKSLTFTYIKDKHNEKEISEKVSLTITSKIALE
jgi:predicted small metal-binding protein